MKEMERKPLEKRLMEAGSDRPNFLAAFEIFFEDYFMELSQMCGDAYYEGLYNGVLGKLVPGKTYCVLAEVAAWAAENPEDGREVLYRMFAEPFIHPVWEVCKDFLSG